MSQLKSSDSYDFGVNTVSQSGFALSDPRMELILPADRHVPLYIEMGPQFLHRPRWHHIQPVLFNNDRQLQQMNQEMQRLTSEMNRLWHETGSYRGPHFPALEFDSKPFGDFVSLTPHIGGAVHAESWRKKENYHLDNPVIKDREGRHQFRLEFDLRQFKPEEIVVATEGNQLTVQARHEETSQGKKARREYFRQCTIPSNVDPLTLVSRHSHSGILSVYAPLPAEESRMIRITQK